VTVRLVTCCDRHRFGTGSANDTAACRGRCSPRSTAGAPGAALPASTRLRGASLSFPGASRRSGGCGEWILWLHGAQGWRRLALSGKGVALEFQDPVEWVVPLSGSPSLRQSSPVFASLRKSLLFPRGHGGAEAEELTSQQFRSRFEIRDWPPGDVVTLVRSKCDVAVGACCKASWARRTSCWAPER
jgi:hypothetical protein